MKKLYFAGILGVISTSSLCAQTLIELGTLGGTYDDVISVSADGSVIVGSSQTTGNLATRAFKYTGGGMTSLGTLGGTDSYAGRVSADGSVIVGYSQTSGDAANLPFKYSGGVMTSLGTLGGTIGNASDVSADGSVIVGSSHIAAGFYHAYKYSAGVMTSLGTLGGNNSYGLRVSADGSVIVGQSQTTDGHTVAFKYTNVMTSLGTLGGNNSAASAVSADGSVIAGYSYIAGNAAYRAFKYTVADGMQTLGTLGGNNSLSAAVSADGSVIVGESQLAGDVIAHAFKYSGTTMTDLGTLGGTYSTASAVSADGSVIVGNSTLAGDTANRAFVYNNEAAGPLVDVQNTYSALASNGYQLNSILNAQNTLLAVSLNYDCTVYGANNVCIGVGGRYTNVSNPTTTQTAGNIQLGYRPHPSLRIGAFLDQGISYTTPSNYTVNNSQPLAGVFAVYAPTGTALGPQVKVSGAYGSNGATIARTTLANTEAGQGNSTLTTQGAQLEAAYGIAANENWIVSPLAGVKATSVSRNGYTETAGASFPITYNAVTQSATTVFAGAKVMGYVTPKVSVGVNAGVEQDLNSSVSNNSGSIYYLGGFSLAAPSIQKTRAFVGANTAYWLDKNERVSLGVYYNQQSLNTSNGITAMLNYTIGL